MIIYLKIYPGRLELNPPMLSENLYIHTIGCQMNVYDSHRIAELLRPLHYEPVDAAENADLVVVNTCAIRAKAEQKVFSYLGRLAELKARRPGLIIAVGGCVAQQEGKKILDRMPAVDLVFGTHAIGRLPAHILSVKSTGRRFVDLQTSDTIDEIDYPVHSHVGGKTQRFVTIMQGCDNYCTYCVVPYVRGKESSRSADTIVAEIEQLVDIGVKEVILLGQNVNSYGKAEGTCSFPELLSRVNNIPGLTRIRFTTSHPKDLSTELIQLFGTLEKLCNHIHLPVQSGSDLILKRMNRGYTQEIFLEKVNQLRHHCPKIAITSDFIVGFPGESEDDFADTLHLIQKVAFDGLFAFMYSDRPNAPAGRFKGKISDAVKSERLQKLLELQESITVMKNKRLVGSFQSVLVEGLSKKVGIDETVAVHQQQWTGRTPCNRIVHFIVDGPHAGRISSGDLIEVRIDRAFSHSLRGKALFTKPVSVAPKGECHAA